MNLTPTILVDSREKRPLAIRAYPTEVVTLGTGDYSISGFSGPENPCFILERKSLNDLAGSLGRDRDRFLREVERMRGFRFRGLLIEGTREQVERHDYRSEIAPQSILASLDALAVRCGIHLFWCGSPDGAARQLESLVRQFARGIVKDYRRIMDACETEPQPATLTTGGKTIYAPATDPNRRTLGTTREKAATGLHSRF
jgi:ERCC4-type nuclease